MIDIRAARNDPERFRAALARRGAAQAFDELLAADARWRELVPQVDELRAQQKLQGKPTPEQLEELKARKERLNELEAALAAAEAERDAALAKVPNVPHESAADGMTEDEILKAYPDIQRDDIREALRYAAEAVRERELPIIDG